MAVKLLPAGDGFTPPKAARFRIEAEAMASLTHPNVVPVYEYGEAESGPCLVMPLMAGGSLAKWLAGRADRRRAPREAAQLVRDIAFGVHHPHQRGLIHRDLKPGNILRDADGVPHVADFGLARRLAATTTGAVTGTWAYMAPEQAGGKPLTTAVDVYALTATARPRSWPTT